MSIKTDNMVFVFGSNLAGIHGRGAARFAMNNRGAQWGRGIGHTGQSYAIPTKGVLGTHKDPKVGPTLELHVIKEFVDAFLLYAKEHPELQFQVTAIGCGLAGLHHRDIAPMFRDAPDNCWFDDLWKPYLYEKQFWGTF